jgi:uncharacterized membrane protein (DUF4010 family)
MELQTDILSGFVTAIGIGVMIGTVREKLHTDHNTSSGIRTHALLAVICCAAMTLGLTAFLVAFAVIGALVVVVYRYSMQKDAGMTGEVAMLATAMLSALASQDPPLASALGVLVAGLLLAKAPLRRFSREIISTSELQDALLLGAAILVVLPLLPKQPLDPWGVLVPYALWRIVVLIMGVGMVGHVALRVVGTYWGMPLTGFFSGFVSSTAATVSFGHHVRKERALLDICIAATLLSTTASLFLFAMVLQVSAPDLFHAMVWPLSAALLCLVLSAVFWMHHSNVHGQADMQLNAHAFNLKHALIITVTISLVMLVSVFMRDWLGDNGAIAAAVFVGLAEIHAAAFSLAHLSLQPAISLPHLQWGLWGVLAASALSKTVFACVSGGWRFGLNLALSLLLMLGVFAATLLWMQWPELPVL